VAFGDASIVGRCAATILAEKEIDQTVQIGRKVP